MALSLLTKWENTTKNVLSPCWTQTALLELDTKVNRISTLPSGISVRLGGAQKASHCWGAVCWASLGLPDSVSLPTPDFPSLVTTTWRTKQLSCRGEPALGLDSASHGATACNALQAGGRGP